MRDAHAINFRWLIMLRWGAIGGQIATVAVVGLGLGITLPLAPLAVVLALEIATNVACALWIHEGRAVREGMLAALMLTDIVLLTALLSLTGGPFNPFSCLYLVNIALAAVVLRPAWTWTLVVGSLACFAALFAQPQWGSLASGGRAHAEHMQMHLEGMWVAFGVAAVFIVYFVQRVTRALAARDAELAAARVRTARHERLASLATLAAGAAHELATPLSTIAVAAKELERQLARGTRGADAAADARLIREQVERCRNILEHMAVDAGQSAGEAIVVVRVGDLVEGAVRGFPDRACVRVSMDDRARHCTVDAPPRAVQQALRGVLENARHASAQDVQVELRVRADEACCRIEVRDEGTGMPPEVLARAGEPFFTTKPPGEGMGLGLFLARAVLERLGGKLELSSEPGNGTTAALVLPSARLMAA
jgi:two-component system sensor histidine kinase RegB